jgi:hypothetical protein
LGTTAIWGSGLLAARRPENACERVRKTLISLLHERERARKVGTVYLRSPLGHVAPPQGLAETVLANLGPDADNGAIRRHVMARIRRELQDVRVIALDGWIISPTEAQLCGLAVAGETLSIDA